MSESKEIQALIRAELLKLVENPNSGIKDSQLKNIVDLVGEFIQPPQLSRSDQILVKLGFKSEEAIERTHISNLETKLACFPPVVQAEVRRIIQAVAESVSKEISIDC